VKKYLFFVLSNNIYIMVITSIQWSLRPIEGYYGLKKGILVNIRVKLAYMVALMVYRRLIMSYKMVIMAYIRTLSSTLRLYLLI
jgi:hypothetical protein